MSDLRSETARSAQTNRDGPNPPGSFIWYELMTPDPDGAKAFYDAVVGWDVEQQPSGIQPMSIA